MVYAHTVLPSANAKQQQQSAVLAMAAQRGLLRPRADYHTNEEHQLRQQQRQQQHPTAGAGGAPFYLHTKQDMLRYLLKRLLQLQQWNFTGTIANNNNNNNNDLDASAAKEGTINLAQLGIALLKGVQLCSYAEAGRDFVLFTGKSSYLNDAGRLRRWIQAAGKQKGTKRGVHFEGENGDAAAANEPHAPVEAADEPLFVLLLFNMSALADSNLFNALILRFVQGVHAVDATGGAAAAAAAAPGFGSAGTVLPPPRISIHYLCLLLHYVALKMLAKLHDCVHQDELHRSSSSTGTKGTSQEEDEAAASSRLYSEVQLLLNLFSVLSVLNFFCREASSDDSAIYTAQLFQSLLKHEEGNARTLNRYVQVKLVRLLQQLKLVGQSTIRWTRVASEGISSNFIFFLELIFEHDDGDHHGSRLDLLVIKILAVYLKMFPLLKLSLLRFFERTNDTELFDFTDYFKMEVLVDNCVFMYANAGNSAVTRYYSIRGWVLSEAARNAVTEYSTTAYVSGLHPSLTGKEKETASADSYHYTPAHDVSISAAGATPEPAITTATAARYGLTTATVVGPAPASEVREEAWDDNSNSNSTNAYVAPRAHPVVDHDAAVIIKPKKWRKRTLEELQKFNFGYIGLSNIGNTCFLNSTTQLVFAADYFAKELIYTTFFHSRGGSSIQSDHNDDNTASSSGETPEALVRGNVQMAVKVLSDLLQPRDTYGKYRRSRYTSSYYGGGDDDLDAYEPRKAKVCLAVLFAQMYVQLYEHLKEAIDGVVEDEEADEDDHAAGSSSGSHNSPNHKYGTRRQGSSDTYGYSSSSNSRTWRSGAAAAAAAALDPSYFVEALPYPFHTRTQQDASEYNKVVFDIVDTEEKKECAQQKEAGGAAGEEKKEKETTITSVTKWFAGTSQTTMICNDCGAARRHTNEFLDLCIPIKRVKQIEKKIVTVAARPSAEAARDPWDSPTATNGITDTTATTNDDEDKKHSEGSPLPKGQQLHHVAGGGAVAAVTTYGSHVSSSCSDSNSSHTSRCRSSSSSSVASSSSSSSSNSSTRAAAARNKRKLLSRRGGATAASHDPYGDSSEDESNKNNRTKGADGGDSDDDSNDNQKLRSCTSAPSPSPSSAASMSPTATGPPAAPAETQTVVEVVTKEVTVDLQTLLLAVTVPYWNQELLTADNQTTCAACAKKTDTRLYTQVVPNAPAFPGRTPFYLTLQVNRFEYNKKFYNYSKVFEQVPLNEILFLPVCHRAELDAAPQLVPYTIKAVIVHSGSTPHSGHYYCIVRRRHHVATARTTEKIRQDGADADHNKHTFALPNEKEEKRKKALQEAEAAAAEREREKEAKNQSAVKAYIRNYLMAFMSYYNSCITAHKDDLPTLNDKLYHLYENFTLAQQQQQQKEREKDAEDSADNKNRGNYHNIVISSDFYDQWYVCNDSNTSAANMERIRTIFCHHNNNKKEGEGEEEEAAEGSGGAAHNYFTPYRGGGRGYMNFNSMETSYLLLYEQTNMDGSLKENENVFAAPVSAAGAPATAAADTSENTFYDDARYLFQNLPASLQPLCVKEPSLQTPPPQPPTTTNTTSNGYYSSYYSNNDNSTGAATAAMTAAANPYSSSTFTYYCSTSHEKGLLLRSWRRWTAD